MGYRWYLIGSMLSVGATTVAVVLIVLWQIGIPPIAAGDRLVATGWQKLQPLYQTIVYAHPDNFSAALVNVDNVPIKITGVTVREEITSVSCTASVSPVKVAPGDAFKLSALCAGTGKNKGDAFSMNITLTYEKVSESIITTHIESGRIRGPAE